jgi:hypothetical protein
MTRVLHPYGEVPGHQAVAGCAEDLGRNGCSRSRAENEILASAEDDT